jgi:uncharacterized BrkB/YihY/UPF0761 family membrane protein
VSTANPVPETFDLTGTDAATTLARTSKSKLVADAVARLRAADGFSHARSMAFAMGLIFVQGVIALVGLASAVGSGGLSRTIVRTLETVVPGATGLLLSDAVRQAHEAGATDRWVALVLGTLGALITGMTLLGQVERALNRLYGIERDRPTLAKYGRAFLLTLSAGVLSVVAFGLLMLGRDLTSGGGAWRTAWEVAGWPLAAILFAAATGLVFRWSPRRHQPGWSWLAAGATASVALLTLTTFVLDALFRLSSSFGQTYGPLAGIVALSFWTFGTSLSVLLGAALAAQLEAIRAGVPAPRVVERAPRAADLSEPATVVAS